MTGDHQLSGPFLRYWPDVEVVQPNEAQDIAAVREIFAELRAHAFDKHRRGLRNAHADNHGVVRGILRIHDDLPDELRQGLFARPRQLPVIIRFFTAPGDVVPDGFGTARGMAIKVTHLLGETLRSQGVRWFGDDIAKISEAPVSANLAAPTGQHVPLLEASALRDLTSQFFADGQGV